MKEERREQGVQERKRERSAAWRQERLLGQGAFAKVWLVRETESGRRLACKVAETEQGRLILEREAAVQRTVEHPLFAGYVDFVQETDRALLFMEYVEGEELSKILERGGALPQSEAARIALRLTEGLRYLHERPRPLLYRDLKPENIRITGNGEVKLLDLGCVCALDEARHSKAGSRGYAAPEQMEAAAGRYSDVYAMGKLLHYMLTGQDPCQPPYRKHLIRAYDPQLSPLLERLVEQCTAEEPARRLPDMRAVQRQLRPFLEPRKGAGLWLKERGALLHWFFSGRKWETDFLYEKSVSKLPDLY